MTPEYSYHVVVDENFPRERPSALVRTWGPDTGAINEEYFSPRLAWEPSSLLEDISRGSLDYDHIRIAEHEVESYVAQLTHRYKEHERHQHGWVK